MYGILAQRSLLWEGLAACAAQGRIHAVSSGILCFMHLLLYALVVSEICAFRPVFFSSSQ